MPLTYPSFAGGISGGNTSGDTGTVFQRVVFAGGNNITLSGSTSAQSQTITISAGAGGAGLSAGMSTNGNTSGNTGLVTGQLALIGGNNITLSGSTNAGSMSLTISAPNLGAGAMSVGVSTGGNTSGSTGVTGTRLVLAGSNNITLSQSTDANGGTVTFSGGPVFSGGVSTMGNTAGATGITGTQLVFVGTGDISLSQTTDANGGTITIDSPKSLAWWCNMNFDGNNIASPMNTTNWTGSTRTLFLYPLVNNLGPFPGPMTINTMQMMLSVSASTASITNQHSVGFSVGLYKISATDSASTLSLVNSVGSSFTQTTLATSAATNSYFGIRHLTFHSSQWSAQPVLSAGETYIMGVLSSWSSISFNTLAVWGQVFGHTLGNSGSFNAGSRATSNTQGFLPYYGYYSATTTGMPASIHISNIRKAGDANELFANFMVFNNLLSSY